MDRLAVVPQIRAVPSLLPVMTYAPSGLIAVARTSSVWPARTARGWWVAALQSRAVPSQLPVRAAGWLFVLCVLTAGLVGCVALTDARSVGGVLLAPPRVVATMPAA